MTEIDEIPAPLARFFPGLFPDSVEDMYPMYPMCGVGMPPPGIDFARHAEHLGDAPVKKTTSKKKTPTELGPWLEALYRAALYRKNFVLPIQTADGLRNVKLVPGHLWGYSDEHTGPVPSDVMIIGKHPGIEETARQQNFVGQTSEYLITALSELGVTEEERSTWYVKNLVHHMPPDRSRDALPADLIKNCLPLLHQELRLVKPKFVLCLGVDATKAVIGRTTKMSDALGRIYDLDIPLHLDADSEPRYHRIRVMCCSHPAKIARAPELYDKPEFLGALGLFVELARGERTGVEEQGLERDYIQTELDLDRVVRKVLDETSEGGVFALDAEWHGPYPWEPGSYLRTIQFSHRPKYAASIVIRKQGGDTNPALCDDYVRSKLTELLRPTLYRPIRLVGHNLKADLPWLKHHGLDLTRLFEAPPDDPNADGDLVKFGWQKTVRDGGFDTLLAAHAVNETGPFKLELIASQYIGSPRYDAPLQEYLKSYCKANKMDRGDLLGYGDVPEDLLLPYGAYDADVTRRLFDVYNGTDERVGLLDCDQHDNNSREAFWRSMRANPAAMEIETVGLLVDRELVVSQITTFSDKRDELLDALRVSINWPNFNPESIYQRTEFLFGESYGKKDEHGEGIRVRPEGAVSLYLEPVASTDGRPWSQSTPSSRPSTDKTTIGILSPGNPVVSLYRDLRYISQTLKTVLRPANVTTTEDGETDSTYEGGLMSFVGCDGRVRTRIFPVETGRWSSSKPNLMNYSSARDADYKRILGKAFRPLRSLFVAPPGYVLLEADYTGAELAVTAWLCGDEKMIDHCRRALLPEDDPDFYDIHSNIAVSSFGLKCPPTKGGLKAAGASHLRTAAKRRIFGLFYGQSDESALLKIREEAPNVTLDEVAQTTVGIHQMYRGLEPFFNTCRRRVSTHGWIRSPYGRLRRCSPTNDRKLLGELERQFMNFDIQSPVADAVAISLDNFTKWRRETGVPFDILLQVHDAIYLCAPAKYAVRIYEEAMPACMCDQVPFVPCNLDGNPISRKVYHFGIDRKMSLRWGEPLTVEQAKTLDIPETYAKH